MKRVLYSVIFFILTQAVFAQKITHTFNIDGNKKEFLCDYLEIISDSEGRFLQIYYSNDNSKTIFEYGPLGKSTRKVYEDGVLTYTESYRETKYIYSFYSSLDGKKVVYLDKNGNIYKVKEDYITIYYYFDKDKKINRVVYDTGDEEFYFKNEQNSDVYVQDIDSFLIEYNSNNNITYYLADDIEYIAEYDNKNRLIYSKKIFGKEQNDSQNYIEQEFKYDLRGNCIYEKTNHVMNNQSNERIIESVYNKDGKLLELNDGVFFSKYEYDENGLLISNSCYENNELYLSVIYKYDDNLNQIYECSTESNVITEFFYFYDENHNIILEKKVIVDLEEQKRYEYFEYCDYEVIELPDKIISRTYEYTEKNEKPITE